MSNVFEQAIAADNVDDLATLLEARVRGLHLNAVYDAAGGEEPEDIIIDLVSRITETEKTKLRQAARKVVSQLQARIVPSTSISWPTDAGQAVTPLLRLCRILDILDHTIDAGLVMDIARALTLVAAPNAEFDAQEVTLCVARLLRLLDRMPNSKGSGPAILLQLLQSSFFCERAARAAALETPSTLLVCLPSYRMFGTLPTAFQPRHELLRLVLSGPVTNALNTAYNTPQVEANVDAELHRTLRATITLFASDPDGRQLADTLVSAIAVSRAPCNLTVDCEETYLAEKQRGQLPPAADQNKNALAKAFASPTFNSYRTDLRHSEPIKNVDARNLALRLQANSMPFAEQAPFLVWAALAKELFGFDISFEYTDWDQVPDACKENTIGFALYNEALEKRLKLAPSLEASASSKGEQLKIVNSKNAAASASFYRSQPLLNYSDYDLLISDKALMRLHAMIDHPEAKKWLEDIILGKHTPNALKSIDESVFDAIRPLLPQFTFHSLGEDNDVREALVTFLGDETTRVHIANRDASPTALASLLDGNVDFFIGGAMQSHYARSRFRHRVHLFARIPNKVTSRAYLKREIYRRHKRELDALMQLWPPAVQLMRALVPTIDVAGGTSAKVTRTFPPALLVELREVLLEDLNRLIPFTGFFDFDPIAEMLREHTTLIVADNLDFEPMHRTDRRKRRRRGAKGPLRLRLVGNGER